MKLIFDTHGNEKQKEVCRLWLDPQVIDILYGGSKGSGKSYLGVSLIFGDAFMYPGTHYFIARKNLASLVRHTIPSIHEVFTHWGIASDMYRFNGQYNFFELYNGSRVYLIDAAFQPGDPMFERFGSLQMTRGWIEEGGEFTREAKSNLQACIGRWKNEEYGLTPKLLVTCNPSNNFLLSDYYTPWKKGELPEWRRFIQALPTDNKKLAADYIPNLLKILSPQQKERLIYGNWEYDDDPAQLIDFEAILDAFTNEHIEDKGLGYISTDLAGKGRDKWVVSTWKGLTCRFPTVQGFSEGKEMETKLRTISTGLQIPRSRIVADSDGLGFYLESYLNGIREFHGNAKPFDGKRYSNLKTECAYKLAELINKRMIRIVCSEEQRDLIVQELGVLKALHLDSDESKLRIISKDKMKEILGRSPDFLDTLIMRMCFEIKPAPRGVRKAVFETGTQR